MAPVIAAYILLISSILGDRAKVEQAQGRDEIIILPPDSDTGKLSKYHLEYIKDPKWNSVVVPKEIKLCFFGWTTRVLVVITGVWHGSRKETM
jgi:hypothetical protein